MIAQVIINTTAKKLNTIFDYNIPEDLQEYISIGTKVMVPFGRKKDLEEGFVVGIKETSEYEVKDISICDMFAFTYHIECITGLNLK